MSKYIYIVSGGNVRKKFSSEKAAKKFYTKLRKASDTLGGIGQPQIDEVEFNSGIRTEFLIKSLAGQDSYLGSVIRRLFRKAS